MCLTAKKQSILVGFFSAKRKKWLFSVHDTFDLETVFYPVTEAILGFFQ